VLQRSLVAVGRATVTTLARQEKSASGSTLLPFFSEDGEFIFCRNALFNKHIADTPRLRAEDDEFIVMTAGRYTRILQLRR
jgi:hypothetical protein